MEESSLGLGTGTVWNMSAGLKTGTMRNMSAGERRFRHNRTLVRNRSQEVDFLRVGTGSSWISVPGQSGGPGSPTLLSQIPENKEPSEPPSE